MSGIMSFRARAVRAQTPDMSWVMVDVESDGPIPGDYSLVCFGAVIIEAGLERSFYGRLRPISEMWNADALAVSGFSREETLTFDDPKDVMTAFEAWLRQNGGKRLLFISDNNGFDWQFINWYFHLRRVDDPAKHRERHRAEADVSAGSSCRSSPPCRSRRRALPSAMCDVMQTLRTPIPQRRWLRVSPPSRGRLARARCAAPHAAECDLRRRR